MCDTVVVVRPDQVLFAKNSDRDPNEAQVLEWIPAQTHEAGSNLKCTWIEVPQAARTNAVLLSRPFWMWGAEIGANEHGVTIGNEAVFTNQPYANTGLTGMDLLRLALERAESAVEAMDVIVSLLDRFGQGGECGFEEPGFTYHNSFIVADSTSAYVLETAGGKSASEQVTKGARSISNGLTIPGFADEYSDWLKTTVSQCKTRQPSTQRLSAHAMTPSDLISVLRDHGDGRAHPDYSLLNGAMGAPCMHGGGIATGSQTTASWAADLTTGTHWVTGTAAPCTSLFKPVSVDNPIDLGAIPGGTFDSGSIWWNHERLHRRVVRNPQVLNPLFVGEHDAIEQDWHDDVPDSAEAFRLASEVEAIWIERIEARTVQDGRPAVARRYWKTRDKVAAMPHATTR